MAEAFAQDSRKAQPVSAAEKMEWLCAQIRGISNVLAEYYGESLEKPGMRERVDSFLQWAMKSNLPKRFKEDCQNGKVKFESEGNDLGPSVTFLLGSWLGSRYSDFKAGELAGIKPIDAKMREQTQDSLQITSSDMTDYLVAGINYGLHENTHLLTGQGEFNALSEAATSTMQERLALPLRLKNVRPNPAYLKELSKHTDRAGTLAKKYGMPENLLYFTLGRRDFYDLFTKMSSDGKGAGSLIFEYTHFALHPWLKGEIDIKNLSNFKEGVLGTLEGMVDILDQMERKVFNARSFSAAMREGFCLPAGIGPKLEKVFVELQSFVNERAGAAPADFIKRYVELMNAEFGIPKTESWEGFVQKWQDDKKGDA